jgi:hypothetical protein
MEHVTDQNWLAVGLDFVVVVSGIFIGLQVSDWNSERHDRHLEHDYLERLLIDLDHNSQELEKLSNDHETTFESLQTFVKFLVSEQFDQELYDQSGRGMGRMFVFPSPQLRTGTYEELLATGRLTLIQSKSILDTLQQMQSKHRRNDGQLAYFRSDADTVKAELSNYQKLANSTISITENGKLKSDGDFRGLQGNQNLANLVYGFSFNHKKFHYYRKGEMELVLAARQAISCELDIASCVLEPDAKAGS